MHKGGVQLSLHSIFQRRICSPSCETGKNVSRIADGYDGRQKNLMCMHDMHGCFPKSCIGPAERVVSGIGKVVHGFDFSFGHMYLFKPSDNASTHSHRTSHREVIISKPRHGRS